MKRIIFFILFTINCKAAQATQTQEDPRKTALLRTCDGYMLRTLFNTLMQVPHTEVSKVESAILNIISDNIGNRVIYCTDQGILYYRKQDPQIKQKFLNYLDYFSECCQHHRDNINATALNIKVTRNNALKLNVLRL